LGFGFVTRRRVSISTFSPHAPAYSNPALLRGSPERRIAERAGWQIPADGPEIVL
jgi:hypothetical protein